MFPNGAVYTPTDTVQGVFNTYDTDGLPITLGGNPVLRLERNRGGTWSEVTTTASAGMTLSVDEDDTGRHEYTVDLDHANVSAAAGDAYRVAINVGTVDGQSIVGAPVGTFYVLADGLTSQQKADVEAESVDALQSLKLDHLVAVADADDVADDSIMAKLAAGDGDWSSFAPSTDALQAIRDTAPLGTAMRGTDSAATAAALSALTGTIATLDALKDKIEAYFQLLMRSDAAIETDRATELSEINADEGSGAGDYSSTSDSMENAQGERGVIDGNVDAVKAVTDLLPNSGALSSLATAAALATTDGKVDDLVAGTHLADYFGDPIDSAVDDPGASATVSTFPVDDESVGSKVLVGILRFTGGNLEDEARLVHWTGTTVETLDPDTIPDGLAEGGPFSAAPADNDTFRFIPLS